MGTLRLIREDLDMLWWLHGRPYLRGWLTTLSTLCLIGLRLCATQKDGILIIDLLYHVFKLHSLILIELFAFKNGGWWRRRRVSRFLPSILYSGHLLLIISLCLMLFNSNKYNQESALQFNWDPIFWGFGIGPEKHTYNCSSLQTAILDEMKKQNWLGPRGVLWA